MNDNEYRQSGSARQTNIPLLPRIEPQMFADFARDPSEMTSLSKSEGGTGRARDRSPSEELYDFATCSKKAKLGSTTTASDGTNGDVNRNEVDDDDSSKEMAYPSNDIRLTKVGDGQWMCDICKEAIFTSFGEACIHEVVCKMIARDSSGCTLQALLTTSSNSQEESKDDTANSSNKEPGTPLKPSPLPMKSKADSKETTPHEAQKPVKEVQSEDEPSKQAGCPSRTEAKVLNVSIFPKEDQRDILSDYNYILTQNIEFFESVTKMGYAGAGSGGSALSFTRVGLRCIHCSGHSYHITAASFFPSSTASIASGLGTIGSRHFLGGKCPSIPPDVSEQLRTTKKSSQVQTRSVGRIGLDAYCKDLANQNGIATHKTGGIFFVGEKAEKAAENEETEKAIETEKATETAAPKGTENPISASGDELKEKPTTICDEIPKEGIEKAPIDTGVANVDVPQKEYTGKPEKIEASSFVPGRIENFWECKHCTALPVPWRAAGSVVFSSSAPSLDVVKGHLEKCQGLATLSIPRTAEIGIGHGEKLPPIRISWDNRQLLKKSDNIERQKANGGSTRKNSLLPSGEVKTGVEKTPLVFPDDRELTTDFAYTTMTLLKKCFLTKSGGSRGNCPIGYPGLACSYCIGQPNERRFFYTSADHLRNSFSHIPSHLVSCSRCPNEVKQNLESLKALRNKQKAMLNAGSHKVFIDRVWSRLHGPNDVRKEDHVEEDSDSSDDESEVSIDELCGSAATVLAEMKTSTRSSQPSAVSKIEFGSSDLVLLEEKHLTTDFAYLSLLQCEVYNLTEGDLAQGLGEVGLPVLSCKHCVDEVGGRKLFFARSASHLRNTLSSVSNHLAVCAKCPQELKAQLESVKKLRAEQEADLKRGMHLKFCEKVWSRLIMHDRSEKPEIPPVVLPNGTNQLVISEDQLLVSDFTYYTMTQMIPCFLDASGNGARSTFEPGWPGLACMHCSGHSNNRKFYYRNSEILAGNYAHIPNHLMSCRQCPLQVKASLAEKKKTHPAQKSKLSKGSQRMFFDRVWARLHFSSSSRKEEKEVEKEENSKEEQFEDAVEEAVTNN